ncbi:MAG: hypothetical protein A2161_15180 [Candidatus Schekmanbacteria bacterium RBG_13_48_7]|uniref:HEAT repeat domain-containing protein n=1 Tax=Candidatus Schekmanbacteria bacterium RBG_13_48_7 TaxID=1817878 RepID=A0A1F7RWB0_9BACT|nr:MAG: hypothetical protein A2161_15180 [Candidatus Schekmanbacteria bacterium RBG_13_48_7]
MKKLSIVLLIVLFFGCGCQNRGKYSSNRDENLEYSPPKGDFNIDTQGAIKFWLNRLENGTPVERYTAALGLGLTGKKAQEAETELIKASNMEQGEIKKAAMAATCLIIPQTPEGFKIIQKSLESKDEQLIMAASRALLVLKPDSEEVLPLFLWLLQSEDDQVIKEASKVLAQHASSLTAHISLLSKIMMTADRREVTLATAYVLAGMGKEVVPELRKALKSERAFVREAGATGLFLVRADARDAYPDLIEATKDNDPNIVIPALRALGVIAENPNEVVPLMINILKTTSSDLVKDSAIQALGGFTQVSSDAVKAVTDMLSNENERIRISAVESLKTAGTNGFPAIPLLEKAMNDKSKGVRWRAADAIILLTKLQGKESSLGTQNNPTQIISDNQPSIDSILSAPLNTNPR